MPPPTRLPPLFWVTFYLRQPIALGNGFVEAMRAGRTNCRLSSGDAIQSPGLEGLSEPRETVPNPLTMVASANGHGSVIDDEDVVSMKVTASPRRPTFLQQARWDAVQKAKLEGMSIRKMARELGLHRDTVRRYIDVENPPTRRVPATLPASTSDTIKA